MAFRASFQFKVVTVKIYAATIVVDLETPAMLTKRTTSLVRERERGREREQKTALTLVFSLSTRTFLLY